MIGPGATGLWLEGSVSRAITVEIDGRRVGQVEDHLNNPGAFMPVGELFLAPGEHEVRISMGGGGLAPGDAGYSLGLRHIGPLVFSPPGKPGVGGADGAHAGVAQPVRAAPGLGGGGGVGELAAGRGATVRPVSEQVHLTIRYTDAGDGWVTAQVAEIPGAISEGSTRQEARSNVLDALEVLLKPDEELAGAPAPHDSESLTLTVAR